MVRKFPPFRSERKKRSTSRLDYARGVMGMSLSAELTETLGTRYSGRGCCVDQRRVAVFILLKNGKCGGLPNEVSLEITINVLSVRMNIFLSCSTAH